MPFISILMIFYGGGKVLCAMLVYLKGIWFSHLKKWQRYNCFWVIQVENVFLHPGVPKITHTIQYAYKSKATKNWSLGFEPLVAVSASVCQNPTIPTVPMDIGYTIPKSKFGRSYWGLPNSRHALCSWWSTCKNLQTQPRANEVHTWHLCQVSLVDQRKNKHIRIWCACRLKI